MGLASATEDLIYDMFKLAIIEYLFNLVGHIFPGAGAAVVILVLIWMKHRNSSRKEKANVGASGVNRASVHS